MVADIRCAGWANLASALLLPHWAHGGVSGMDERHPASGLQGRGAAASLGAILRVARPLFYLRNWAQLPNHACRVPQREEYGQGI